MSATSRHSGEKVNVRPHYVNDHYLQEVGVISVRSPDDKHHLDNSSVDECQLIERVKLSSSEIESKHLRLSTDLSEDVFYSNAEVTDDIQNGTHGTEANFADDVIELDPDDIVLTLNPGLDDATMFYETQTDETTLIRYAKLADDSRSEASKCSAKLIHDIVCANSEEKQLFEGKLIEEKNGLRSPVNSVNDDDDSEDVKKQLAMRYDHEEKLIVSHSKSTEGKYQMKLPDTAYVAQQAKQTPRWTDKSAVLDEDPIDNHFQALIVEVVKHLQDCDLDEILSMFSGSGILEMTGLVPPSQLMEILQEHRLISRDNLHHLQELIMRLDDTDLFIKAVQYTRHHHDIVFFYQDKDIPTKGFGKIKCFLSGRDFTRLTREDLELVRFKTASLIFVPAHFVYIVGIEPGQRVIVTLMLQERYVQEMSEMAREGLPELSLVNVDAIQIFGKTYSTVGTTAVEKYRDNGYSSFLSVYQQLRDKSKRLEERDVEVTKLREEAELMQLELETMGAELEMLTEKAVLESVARQHSRHRPSNKHSRTRSFPLSNKEEPSDRQFTLALESAVMAKSKPCFAIDLAKSSGKMVKIPLSNQNQGQLMSPGVTISNSKVNETFHQTNDLMDEIESIIKELNSASA